VPRLFRMRFDLADSAFQNADPGEDNSYQQPFDAVTQAAAAPGVQTTDSIVAGAAATSETIALAGSGLIFNNLYSINVSLPYRTAIVEAENFLQSQFSNSVTLNVSFDLSSLPLGDSAENDSLVIRVPYTTLVSTLSSPSIETTADDRAAVASLPAGDPNGGLGFFIPIGMARLLGFTGAPTGNDVTVDLNQNLPWTFGADAVGAIEHELTEAMGRTGGLGIAQTSLGNPIWAPMDLFRYSSQASATLQVAATVCRRSFRSTALLF
jgi:hypothetical protein